MVDITVKFQDGGSFVYRNAPTGTTQIQAMERAQNDFPERFGRGLANIEGAEESTLGERLKAFATEGQFGPHGVFSSDLPQLLRGVGDSLSFGATSDMSPPQTAGEKDSRAAGREILLGLGRGLPTKAGLTSLLKPPAFSGGSWTAAAQAAAKKAATNPQAAQQIAISPILKAIAKAAGYSAGPSALAYDLYKHFFP